MKQPIAKPGHRARRRFGRAQDTHIDDPYRQAKKPPEPAVCPDCGAVFQGGHWQWLERPAGAELVTCQACHRMRDKYPAGEVTLSGSFVQAHRDDLLAVARHNEAVEKQEHPLNRIMDIDDDGAKIVIRTTDIHLPRRIGEAVHHAYHGKLDVHYDSGAYFVRVGWVRD